MSRYAERYAEIASLAGGLAHEIRNPLSTISMNLDLLVEDLVDSEEARDRRMLDKLHTVQSECHHLEEILDAHKKMGDPKRVLISVSYTLLLSLSSYDMIILWSSVVS